VTFAAPKARGSFEDLIWKKRKAAPPLRSGRRTERGQSGTTNPFQHSTGSSWRKITISNNVGGVNRFGSTLRHALEEERPFALAEGLRPPTMGSLAVVAGQELGPTQPSLR